MPAKRENNFDADKFLENYEERTTAANRGMHRNERPGKREDAPPSTENNPKPDDCTTSREAEYMAKYLLPKKYVRVIKTGKQVAVSDEFKVKIQKLQLFFSDGGTITAYVNNVLEQHFKEYDDIIQKMFNNTKPI